MPILVRNVRLGLDEPEEELLRAAAHRLRVPVSTIRTYSVVRRSVDARRKEDVHFLYQIELELDEPPTAQKARLRRMHTHDASWLEPPVDEPLEAGSEPLTGRPVIIGFGPAGMFAALVLAQHGYRPLVLERGREVRRRHRDIMDRFYRLHEFDPTSNLLFGEGGAGTYSDGKLYTRVHDPLCRMVLELLYQHGADPAVLIDSRPHIGSDRLPTICMRIRRKIESLGGEVRFECHVDDIRIGDGRLKALHVVASPTASGGAPNTASLTAGGGQPNDEWLGVGPTILAVGHSARDTIRMLHSRGVVLRSKPFQIGVRIEHPQETINRWQYGPFAGHPKLCAAEYHLVSKGAAAEYGDVFSFCMCPGGLILPTNESAGLVATNGASRASRSSPFGNSGLVVTVTPGSLSPGSASGGWSWSSDTAAGHATAATVVDGHGSAADEASLALRGLAFLEHWERLAFRATGDSYRVPAQRAADFLAARASDGELQTSYPIGGAWSHIASLVPDPVASALRRALPRLNDTFPGFAGSEGLITAPETRASSPVRMVRDDVTREAVGVANLYPVGEGAGYAGGIVSAAVDGIKSAKAIIRRYRARR